MFASPSAGGAPVQGAKVTAHLGDATGSAITGPDGHFSLKLNNTGNAQAFTVTVEPPAGADLYAKTYDQVPLSAYTSPYGAANELDIYLGTTNPSAALPGAPAKRGCIAGTLKDIGGQPVPSDALPVVPTPEGKYVPRPLYDNCATEFSAIPNFSLSETGVPPQPGETGLVIYGGARTVRTDAQGKYLLPVQTTQNLLGVSGSLWAGNYDGTDTGDLNTANAVFWSKFQYVPEVRVFLTGATDTRDLQLEAFDPAKNPRVTTQPIRYDGSAIQANGAAFVVHTTPSFEHAIFSSPITLGEYFTDDTSDSDNLRVVKLGDNVRSQNITVQSTATRYAGPKDDTVTGTSTFTGWRDGTDLGQALNANFLGIPAPQQPTLDAKDVSRTPTLSWNSVQNATLYYVILLKQVSEDDLEPVWEGYTTATSLSVPIQLDAGAKYTWQVEADDSYEMSDVIGRDPMALEASRWKSAGRLPKARAVDSALNAWRGQVARAFLQATGAVPQHFGGSDAAGQHLLEKGYRYADSQEFTFTTGK